MNYFVQDCMKYVQYVGVYILREINTSFHVKDATNHTLIFTELEGCQFQEIEETKIN